MKQNKALSDSVFVGHFSRGHKPAFKTLTTKDEGFVQLIKDDGSPVKITFMWENKSHEEINVEVARQLVKLGLFHLHDRVAIRRMPTEIHEVKGASTSYKTEVHLMIRTRN